MKTQDALIDPDAGDLFASNVVEQGALGHLKPVRCGGGCKQGVEV